MTEYEVACLTIIWKNMNDSILQRPKKSTQQDLVDGNDEIMERLRRDTSIFDKESSPLTSHPKFVLMILYMYGLPQLDLPDIVIESVSAWIRP